ncbi:MAG: phage holin family protein [Candidatus Riflebacteria bacterium]|nr:phage holin family protein [Candidatus Riflebacteria bacterium]
MTGALITVGVNTLAFYMISEMVPGFDIKSKKTALLMALVYSALAAIVWFAAIPITFLLGAVFAIIAFIPFIGPILAGAGVFVTTFILLFGISAALLVAVDKMMDDFKMKSPAVVMIASVMLALIGVLSRFVLG